MKRFLLFSFASLSSWVLFVGCSSSSGGGGGVPCDDAGMCSGNLVCDKGVCVQPPATGGTGTGGTGTGGTGTGGTSTGGTGGGGPDCMTVCQDCGGGDACPSLCASATPSQLACAQAVLPDCTAAQQCFLGTGGTGGGTGGFGGGTGGFGGGTGGSSSCGALTFAEPCGSCMTGNCCSQLLSCDSGSACFDLFDCIDTYCASAADPQSCYLENCSQYASGAQAHDDVVNCAQTYCPSECGGGG